MDTLYVYTESMSRLNTICNRIQNPNRIEPNERDQINQLLNELSGLDYRVVQLADLQVKPSSTLSNICYNFVFSIVANPSLAEFPYKYTTR